MRDLIYHVIDNDIHLSEEAILPYSESLLKRDGFLHFCFLDQLEHVLFNYFPSGKKLYILEFALDELTAIKLELSSNNVHFPHLYGPINFKLIKETYTIFNPF